VTAIGTVHEKENPMRSIITTRSALLALSMGLAVFSGIGARSAHAAVAALPAFSLPDLEGKAHDSKEWKDKVVLLDFWATWCTGCRETIPVLVRLNGKFGSKGLAVAGISLDKGPKGKIAKFTKKLKMDYQILWDSEDAMSKLFGFEGLPSVYLFGRDGKLIKAMPAYTAAQEKDLEALVEAQFQGHP
jgi:thiol-disulfide isomerase/thioredoxin